MSLELLQLCHTDEKRTLLVEALEQKLKYHKTLLKQNFQGVYDKKVNSQHLQAIECNESAIHALKSMIDLVVEELFC